MEALPPDMFERLTHKLKTRTAHALNAAPHIIWPMRFVLPHQKHLRPAWMIRTGLFLYDHLGGRQTLASSHGVKFADQELMGIPHRLVIGDRGLDKGELEYKGRRDSEVTMVALDELRAFLDARFA